MSQLEMWIDLLGLTQTKHTCNGQKRFSYTTWTSESLRVRADSVSGLPSSCRAYGSPWMKYATGNASNTYCQLSNTSYFQRGSRKFLGLYNQSTRLGRIHFHPLARHYIFLLLHTILQFTLSRCTNPCLTCFRILNMIECSETESTILCVHL